MAKPVTKRRYELTWMVIRVTKEPPTRQLELSHQLDFLRLSYHRAILGDTIPLSIGGGIGQSRTLMRLLRKAHLEEVGVKVWLRILNEICATTKNILALESTTVWGKGRPPLPSWGFPTPSLSLEEECNPGEQNEGSNGVPGGIRTHVIRSHSPAFHR